MTPEQLVRQMYMRGNRFVFRVAMLGIGLLVIRQFMVGPLYVALGALGCWWCACMAFWWRDGAGSDEGRS